MPELLEEHWGAIKWAFGIFTVVVGTVAGALVLGAAAWAMDTNSKLSGVSNSVDLVNVKLDNIGSNVGASSAALKSIEDDVIELEKRTQKIEDTRFTAEDAKLVRERLHSLEQRTLIVEKRLR